MKILNILLVIAFSLPLATLAQGSGEKGNGGDFIRQIFIERGKSIVSHLKATEKKTLFFKRNSISSQSLENVFRIEVIQVSADPLKDNSGSAVDALGRLGSIILDQSSWRTYILKGIKLDKMIIHEALRAIGKNDDNYVISGQAPDLPAIYDQNTVSAGYRLLREEFADSHFPSDAELGVLRGNHLNASNTLQCEEYTWDQPSLRSYNLNLEVWRSKILKLFWSTATVRQLEPNLLYIDRNLQIISGIINEKIQFFLRTHTGKEIILEIIDSRVTQAPTALSNPSLHAIMYVVCELPRDKE